MLDSQSSAAQDLLDTAPEARFDRIARLAAYIFGCPQAFVAFINDDRFSSIASACGTRAEVQRELAICSYTITSDNPLVITDALTDPFFYEHPAVIGEAGFRFYAGQAVHAPDGSRIGTLSVWSSQPFEPTSLQLALLGDLVAQVDTELERAGLAELAHRLEESEQRYRALFEPNPDAVYTIDSDGCFLSVNPASTKLTGYAQEELVGQSFVPLIAADDLAHTLECFQRCLAGEPQFLQIQLQRKNGSRVDVSISISPYIVDGKLVGVAGISRDITEKVAAEQRLLKSEDRLNLALENSAQAVWDWNVQRDQISMYGQMLATLGYETEMHDSREGWLTRVHPADLGSVATLAQQLREGDRSILQNEFRLRCADGKYRWFLDSGRVVSWDTSGKPIRALGTIKDIKTRKAEDIERQREAERMALAVQVNGVGIFEFDLDNNAITWDPRMNALFGVTEDFSPTAEAITGLLHQEDRMSFQGKVELLRQGNCTSLDMECRVVWPEGDIHHLRMLGKVFRFSAESSRLLIGTCWDVTESRKLARQLSYQATHDALTGLVNRYEFEQRLAEAQRTARQDKQEHTLCFIDLDRFKLINDTAGHAAGDALLRELGQLLSRQVRATDVLARLGGDEFGLLLPSCSPARAVKVAEKISLALKSFLFSWDGRIHNISASIGLARLSGDSSSIDDVMSKADIACYTSKRTGRDRISIYECDQDEAGLHHHELRIAAGIREALQADRFCLFAQPIVAATSRKRRPHYELLVRMLNPEGELISPGEFIPAAERYDLMHFIDQWVLREALERQAPQIAAIPDLIISLNLSAQSLNDPAFLPSVKRLIANSPLSPDRIQFEITETAVFANLQSGAETMRCLRKIGCAISLDDFGTGLSSFCYLKEFPVDYIKIDGSFIRSLKDNSVDRAIVKSINSIAHQVGAETVAEYVEDAEIFSIVRKLRIDYAQGYNIGKPLLLRSVLAELGAIEQS